MDFSQINWTAWAGGVSAVLLVVWIAVAFRSRPTLVGVIVGFAHLFAAAINTAAPVRGLVDPTYTEYGFGLLSAVTPVSISTMSAAVFLTAVVGAFSAVRASREARLITAITSLLFLVVLGWPLIQEIRGGIATEILVGGVTIPGAVAQGVLAFFRLGPFLLGLLWGLTKARSSPAATA